MRVFLSAAREARPFSLPNLIGGYERELTSEEEQAGRIHIAAVDPKHAIGFLPQQSMPDSIPATDFGVRLIALPTGKTYGDLPWWEVKIDAS